MIPHPPISTLFPYTTLFRSDLDVLSLGPVAGEVSQDFDRYWMSESSLPVDNVFKAKKSKNDVLRHISSRSEEHTSELQSRPHLVCRLLLEKKKKQLRSRLW